MAGTQEGQKNMEQAVEQSTKPVRPALPLLVLLVFASALGVAVAIALAGVAMLLAAPAYAGDSSLLLLRRAGTAPAELLFAESESRDEGTAVRTRVMEEFYNPFAEQLTGFYLHRLPGNAMLERLVLTVVAEDGEERIAPLAARPALLTLREGAALIERTADIGPAETLRVEVEYLTRSPRRVLAAR
jgi:hypothetical protein